MYYYNTISNVSTLLVSMSTTTVDHLRQVPSAARAKAERNRPAEIEELVRVGAPRAAMASDVFAPQPHQPCPLLGRWLKVAFADV